MSSKFSKIRSSACAGASLIVFLDRAEVVAAVVQDLNLVHVTDWPGFANFLGPENDENFQDFLGLESHLGLQRPLKIGNVKVDLDSRNIVGKGAWGTVYEVPGHDPPAVLKVMNLHTQCLRQGLTFATALKEVFLEFNAMKHFSENEFGNIAKCIAMGMDDSKKAYILMEKAPGQELSKLLGTTDSLSHQSRMEIVRQAMLAVVDCHSRGFLHGDIHPSNFVWDEESSTLTLIDFGKAQQMSNKKEFGGHSFYHSPEILQNSRRDDVFYEVDVWALGIFILEVLFQQPLRADVTNDDNVQGHLKRIKDELSLHAHGIDKDLDVVNGDLKLCHELVLQMLKPDHTQRPVLIRDTSSGKKMIVNNDMNR